MFVLTQKILGQGYSENDPPLNWLGSISDHKNIRCRLVYIKPKISALGSFKMTTMSKGWRDSGNVLAITNNQRAPSRYSKASLIKYNICKLSRLGVPWVKRYCLLYITTISTYWPKETKKPLLLHDKQLQTSQKHSYSATKSAYGMCIS